MSLLTVHAASPSKEPESGATMGSREDAWIQQAYPLIKDLQQRAPGLYWLDFLLSASLAWALTATYFMAPAWSALQIFAFVAASILFFRAGTFIHEIVHMPPRQMQWFGRAWNLFMGIPLLMPWVMYRNHVDHHNARHFGTPEDGEYLPLASSPVSETIKYLAQAPLLPLFSMVRFGLLGPLSWLHPPLREWVLTRASAAVSNPYYSKRFPKAEQRHLLIVEILCFVYIVAVAGLVAGRHVSGTQLAMAYALVCMALSLNWVRNLAAHRYGNEGQQMTRAAQFADSINITGQTWLTALLFPVGLRYHALHHLFPSLPYHALGKAHRRLVENLPPDSPYHAASRNSFFAAVAELWGSASRTSPQQSAMRHWRPERRKP